MKMNRTLLLLAGIALFAACKKDDDEQQPADVAISGKWNKINEFRTITQPGGVVKDTINSSPESNNWTFDPAAGKVYQLKNAMQDTVYYKLIDDNKKVVTSSDEEFGFEADTLSILTLTGNQMKLEGHYSYTNYQMVVIFNFVR